MGTKILVELFNLNNPVAGNYVIDVTTIGKKGNVLEVIAPIAYSTFAGSGTGDITAVNTPAGSGLTGGATNGDVTLSLQLCAAGQVLKSLGSTWACAADNDTDTNSGGTLTSVATGAGLTGGPITTTGTVSIAAGGITSAMIQDGTIGSGDVNSAQIQLRIGSSCEAGSSIRVINVDGTVACEVDDGGAGGVSAVTAKAPLTSSGGPTPEIALPNVIIGGIDTAIGTGALQSNTTGFANTASGRDALRDNTTGNNNTASGVSALAHNTAGIANTASGVQALLSNTGGNFNTASGASALQFNTTGGNNTANGFSALLSNTTGSSNTAIGYLADVSAGNLTNATAIGAVAHVDASNKVRIGNTLVTVIEGQVPFTSVSDKTKKETFQPVDGEGVLRKIRGFSLTSWNYIGHDPEKFRHYGPMAQDFYAAFGNDGVGTIGTPTTINSGDMAGILMISAQALEKRTVEQKNEIDALKSENADLKARLERLEGLVKDRPYLTASSEPVLSKVEGPVQ